MSDEHFLIILGPTASGKTKLAVALADYFDGEIISADSRQIFRGMDVGTGKDLNEYIINGHQIPYHLIDIVEAGERYHVDAFKNDFFAAYENIVSRKKLPILCGGTGMYIHSLLQNHALTAIPVNSYLRDQLVVLQKSELIAKLEKYPVQCRAQADLSSSKRMIRAIEIAEYLTQNALPENNFPKLKPFVIGLTNSVELRRAKIIERLNFRLKNGLIEEVEVLLKKGISPETLIFYGLEYKFIVSYLARNIDYQTLETQLGTAICQFAKRQMTFFRKMEKDGVTINWLNAADDFLSIKENAIQLIENEFESN